MGEAINLVDRYADKPHRRVYTFNELRIPALAVLGWHHSHVARDPLVNHFHDGCIEITLMVQGNIIFSAEGKEYHLRGGDVFITPVNVPHDTGSYPVGVGELYWFQLRLGEPSFLFLERDWAANLQELLGTLRTGILRGVDFSRKYLADMFSFLGSGFSGSSGSAATGDTYQGVSRLINILYRIIGARAVIQDSPSPDIQRAVDFIRANLCDEIALQSLADEAYLSLPRFKQKFQEQIGMSPRMFINAQKVEMARELLARGRSVTETAFDLGFNSSTYFSTVFRKFALIPPREFAGKKS
jgi:AraC-like DNA-binding protein